MLRLKHAGCAFAKGARLAEGEAATQVSTRLIAPRARRGGMGVRPERVSSEVPPKRITCAAWCSAGESPRLTASSPRPGGGQQLRIQEAATETPCAARVVPRDTPYTDGERGSAARRGIGIRMQATRPHRRECGSHDAIDGAACAHCLRRDQAFLRPLDAYLLKAGEPKLLLPLDTPKQGREHFLGIGPCQRCCE
eukprot:scaffold207191_cov35-Tisochrysis_lutea.AAC.2